MHQMERRTINITMETPNIYETLMLNMSDFLNLPEEDYLRLQLGPKHLPLGLVLPITLVYIIIFIMGIFGNVVTCWVILRNPIMQTATNYYLFSLALSDLMLLVLGKINF